jgi:hypothetical protein
MKKTALVLSLLMLALPTRSATLADLIADFRVLTGETDTLTSFYTNADAKVYLNQAQDPIVRLGGYIRRQVDLPYSTDSLSYRLPATFIKPIGGLRRTEATWVEVAYNEGLRDSIVATYMVQWKNTDTAKAYLGGRWTEGDTLRLFYLAKASSMDTVSDVCDVPEDLQCFVLQEAIAIYEQAKRSFEAAALIRQQVRRDMGVGGATQ